MFSTTGLFRTIPCPGRDSCQAVNCIFSHDPDVLRQVSQAKGSTAKVAEPPAKRRRIDDAPSTLKGEARAKEGLAGEILRGAKIVSSAAPTSTPKTLKRAITPPIVEKTSKSVGIRPAALATIATKKETLNPRMLPSPPAGHDKRTLYLRHLYEQLKRLNAEVQRSGKGGGGLLVLDDQELIKASLDEEEQFARTGAAVYNNVVKQRIGIYRKMTMDDWIVHIKGKIFSTRSNEKPAEAAAVVYSGLKDGQEVSLLRDMEASTDQLKKMGYIQEAPSEAAIADARSMVEEAGNYEVCDRCTTRFQVFPDRREADGILTTNGPCVYHWGKLRRPKRQKTDAITGHKDEVYTCCDELMNSPGCATSDTHVYKMRDAPRMATVLQFIDTPDNPAPERDRTGQVPQAITFDCEMGYTALGLELIRLTAVSWPSGHEIMDILVKPKGAILDFNSRFSGVFAEHFKSAVPWIPGMPLCPDRTSIARPLPLPIVPSPEAARGILCSFITPSTPLIGHALENDLNSVRLCHPTIVDTVALFPHPMGLPIRFALKQLASTHLDRAIQTAGASGHDSLEDARATGDLVRVKVAERWRGLKGKGWRFNGDDLVGPSGK